MVKILIILGGLGTEGITNSVLTYLEHMDKTGLDITLGVAGKSDKEQLTRANNIGIKIYFLPGRNIFPIKYFFNMISLIKREKFKIVHVHGNSATLGLDMLAAWIGGARVRIAHSRNTSCTHPLMDKCMRLLFNMTYTDGFACGEDAGMWLFKDKKYTVIPNGKDVNKFIYSEKNRSLVRAELGIKDEIVLGHVGIFNEQKNHDFLIDIFNDLCKQSNNYILCLFGGDGGKLAKIQEKVNAYGLNSKVKFMGFKNDMACYLSGMDIMVFPSLYEGLPNVVVEWQISGLPCLISDKITRECKVFDNVRYLPIDIGTKIWVDAIKSTLIKDRLSDEEHIRKEIARAGYDISQNVISLRRKYLEFGERK